MMDGMRDHLSARCQKLLPNGGIGQMVQCDAVPTAMPRENGTTALQASERAADSTSKIIICSAAGCNLREAVLFIEGIIRSQR